MPIHDHPKLALGTVFAVFLLALGLAIATAPLFSAYPPSLLSSPKCTSSSVGVTCVAFVYNPSYGGHQGYELILASNSRVNCGQAQIVRFILANSTSGQSYLVYAKQICTYNQ